MLPDIWPTACREHKGKGITLSCRRFTEDTVQTDLKEDKQQASDAQRTEKPMSCEVKPDTHRNSRLRPRGYEEPNKTNPGRGKKKNQKKGLKGDASDLAIYLIFLFSEQTLRALREDRVANENESAFNSQQKTSSAGTQIFLREG